MCLCQALYVTARSPIVSVKVCRRRFFRGILKRNHFFSVGPLLSHLGRDIGVGVLKTRKLDSSNLELSNVCANFFPAQVSAHTVCHNPFS